MKIKIIVLLLILLIITSCSSSSNIVKEKDLSKLSLKEAVTEYSRYDEKIINFFQGKVRVESIYLTPKLIKRIQKELDDKILKDKNIQFTLDNFNSSLFLVAFYTPNDKSNDLSKVKSVWNVSLKSDGKIYDSIEKIALTRRSSVFQFFFKNNQEFSRFYIIRFPKVSSKKIELIFSSMHMMLKNIWEF